MFELFARRLAALALLAFAPRASVADDPPESARTILERAGASIRAGVWAGRASGDALLAVEPGATFPTASAIKTALLVELFAKFVDSLDRPPPGLEAILREDHPAVVHFSAAQRDEIRQGLAGRSTREVGGIMMGSVPASNLVYNAAASATIVLLGGPEGATRSIRARDPAFAPIAVRRYMLADRKANGDNEATPAALAAVLRRLASRQLAGVDGPTVDAIRRAILTRVDPALGRVFVKDGDLATDPITCVRSGWAEGAEGEARVFVVMLAREGPGARVRDEAHRDLAATADRVVEALLAPGRGGAR